MLIQVVGINHKTAPLKIRAQVGLTPDQIVEAYNRVHELVGQQGIVILSTCNRTEIYVAGNVSYSAIVDWWGHIAGVERREFSDALFWYADTKVFDHLFRVAAGLDSMVLGETQILGQVKEAYELSQKYGVTGSLHRLFRAALTVGKRAHAETAISHNALSMGHAVVELGRKVFGDLSRTHAVVIGAGEMGTLVARHLSSAKVGNITIVNRTPDRGQLLAEEIHGSYVPLNQLMTVLPSADIIVSSTHASNFLVTKQMMKEAIKGKGERLRFLFDLSVPRNLDPDIVRLGSGIFLYDIDDVNAVVEANLHQRQKEAVKVEKIIQEEIETLASDIAASEVGPVIRQLREKAESIRINELNKALNRLSHLSDADKQVVAETTRLILNKFLNDAMVGMRAWATDKDKEEYIEAVRELFHLDGTTENTRTPNTEHVLQPER
ncbi:glutamyl-tRNA reductase [Sulfobacillus thermosulfidooxidans]|uniref:glutamyl-tRNA reductase n=1 Tax=Sulfobacillus thermosulfidooxidans TaxID=28034 RepID=UPI000316251B|nr:glutamyl-tRNA reductase [Sulfobacillus thermosulfidooxidans]OLZ09844.1 glutamyl-tRNA reductase [Sulfobacillus thermosulfidooxidans]OLZ15850.1 glutamyl-tRNA reductase [Sulfobacillus thermosulfidooxidans]OLZ18303.1 glutamyl-tRNA reductase [Sulfobacillus thermosulfidooxidans]